MQAESYKAALARELYGTEELMCKLHDALHAYRYACGQWRDSLEAQEAGHTLQRRWQTADTARGVFEDLLAHIAVQALNGR